MTTSVASAARTALHEVNLRWPVKAGSNGEILATDAEIAEFAERYATSERSRVIAELAEKVDEFAKGAPSTFGPAPSWYDWQTFAAWLRSQEGK